MKYYIPIHRDNVDNITSAEGVSPMDFYLDRKFGYHYFKPLEEVPSDRELFLFKRIPWVSTVGEKSEDVVVYIEFDDDKQLEKLATSPFNDGIRVAESITLYPWNCKFLFQTEEAMRLSVVMCKMSQNNKMWGYFDFDQLNIKPAPYKTETLKNIKQEIIVNRHAALRLEEQDNRLKGFLYSYVLGRYISLSQPLASLLQTEKSMYDLASTLSGLRGSQAEEFLRELDGLEGIYVKYDPNRTEFQKKWKQMIEEHFISADDQQAFESIIQELGGERIMKNNFARMSGIELRPRYETTNLRNTDWKAYKKELEDYTQNNLMSFRMRKGDTDTKDDFSIKGQQIEMASKYGNFYGKLISHIIKGAEWITLEKLRLNRLDIASDMTRMVRDVMLEYGQDWEGSKERTFLNGLRQHIATGGMFDVSAAPSVVLRSIAIFILKGDDFEEMMRYMEYSAQTDYRFVLGLWGVCIGYADIPKTAIRRMKIDFKGEDNIYLATCQLLGALPGGTILERHLYQFTKKKADPQNLSHSIMDILKDKSLGLSKTQRDEILRIWGELDGRVSKEFFARVSEIKGVGKVKLQKLRQMIPVDTVPVEKQQDLFNENAVTSNEVFDFSAWKHIEPLLPEDQQLRSVVKDDLIWFMNRDRRYEDNQRKIADYGNHLYMKAHPKKASYAWTAEFFGKIDIDIITAELLRVYDNKR